MFSLKPKIALCLCCKNDECKDRLDSSFLCFHEKMSKPTIPLPLSWRGKEWAGPRSDEAPHNTIHPDIIEDIAEAGSRPPRPPVCPAQAEHILLCPLLLVYCPRIVHQWAVLAALACRACPRPLSGLWRSDGSRAIVTVTVTSHSPGGERGTTWSQSCGSTRGPG